MKGEWETVPLERLIEPGRAISYGIVQPGSSVRGGVPIVRVGDVRDGRISTTDPLRVSPDIEAAYGRTRLKGGELLLTLVGTVGEVAVVPESLAGWNVARAVAVIPVRKQIGAYWVQTALHSPQVREIIDSRLNTTVQATLNLRDVGQLPIVLPTQEERDAIAHILGTLDDKIELNRRMNETLEAMVRALFQSWFVDFDPVRAKAEGRALGLPKEIADLFPDRFEDSELGEIPAGWRVTALKNLTTKIGSGATPFGGSAVYVEEGVALIRSQNVHDHQFRWGGLARLTERSATELQGVEVKAEDILFNITGDSILRTCVVDPHVLPARVNQHVAIIRATPGIPPRYLHSLLVEPRMKTFLGGLDAGGTRKAVTKGQLESVSVLQPPREVLARFAETTTPLFQRVDCSRSESRALAALRDMLLPKLISGELRVRDAQRFVGGVDSMDEVDGGRA
ncbi:MAG: restriction endonuclease subunit S [Candidatus Binatia bacterium]